MAVKTFCDRCESELIKDQDKRETVQGPNEKQYLLCDPCLTALDRFFHNEPTGAAALRSNQDDYNRANRMGFKRP